MIKDKNMYVNDGCGNSIIFDVADCSYCYISRVDENMVLCMKNGDKLYFDNSLGNIDHDDIARTLNDIFRA